MMKWAIKIIFFFDQTIFLCMLNSLDILRMKYDEVKHEVIFVQQFLDAVASLALGYECQSVITLFNKKHI